MKRIRLTLILILFSIVNVSPLTTSCRYISDLNQEQIWSFFSFSDFEIYSTLAIGTIGILLLVAALISWNYNSSLSTPSDIIMIIVAGALVDYYKSYAVYYKANSGESEPNHFAAACSGFGFFNMLGNSINLYYNTFFCVALAYSINNTLRKPFLSKFMMHLLCLLATVSAILIIIFTQNSGSPLSGICIYRLASQSSLGLFFLHLLLLTACIYSLRKFRARIPKNSYFQTKSHFRYYNVYLIFFVICQSANTIMYLIGNISCQTQSQELYHLIDDLYSITNQITILQGVGIAILRLSHPHFIRIIKNKITKKSIEVQREDDSEQWIDSLVESIKGSEILSFIEAIMMNYIEHSSKFPQKLTPYHFQKEYSFQIDEVIAQDYVRRRITNRDSHFLRQSSAGLKTLSFEVITYTPQFYSWLFRNQSVNLFRSFDIRKNLSLVKQQSYTEGGKSGEFFFATYDHQFIFKTIKPQESVICTQKSQQFYNYFCNNKDTLLIKILGLYVFNRKDIIDEPVHLILMKNLTLNHKRHNLRVYDIKGSEFNRSTLGQRQINVQDEEKLRKYTLKDKDFLAIEGQVHITEEAAVQLKQILVRDIKFLAGLGVMDYSLLIIKREGPPNKQCGEYESIRQPGIYFNFGIIDYLQQWTLRRKAQRVFKTLITSQEVTSNSPANYANRLIDFIHTII